MSAAYPYDVPERDPNPPNGGGLNVIQLRQPEVEGGDPILSAGLTVAEELAIAWSYAGSWQRRYQSVRVRQYRLLIRGALVGCVVAWLLDGEVAQKVDALLRVFS